VLHDIRHGVPFDMALQRALTGLSEADAALAHEIAAGVLRHRSLLDAALAPNLASGTDGVREDLLDILRIGAYQLRYLERVPRHAAVDTAVTLGRRLAGARVGGFINAVLRKISSGPTAHGGNDPGGTVSDPSGRRDELALRYSHPGWLVDRWLGHFGVTETERLLQLNNTRPELVVQPARWREEALIASLDQQGIRWKRAPFGAGLVIAGRRPQELPGFATGSCFVQDPAQAVVTRYFDLPLKYTVFDACAAPGGKALAMSARGNYLVASDLRPARARRLRENIERAGSQRSAIIVADAGHPPIRPVDAVLLDAPCLGTGTFSRHPDARWRVSDQALIELATQASSLLSALAEVVRPGGLLFFSTCSLEPEENEVQIEAFLALDHRYRREPSQAVEAELLTAAGDLFMLPQRHGTDGAYAARLRRTA
jgi:16S rRNA (cytosine967-C5)-methyltransferase